MSLRMIGIVVNTLLTDEDIRDRFAIDPIQTLVYLNVRGVQLTPLVELKRYPAWPTLMKRS